MKTLVLFLLRAYKRIISPVIGSLFGHACRFTPTCSEYASDAIKKYGILKGGLMGGKRLLKCNPLVKPAFDPVK